MAGPTPIVRQLLLCERVTFNPDRTYTLHNPRVDFVATGVEPLPVTINELWLFVQVTGSFGPQPFRIRLLDVTDPTQAPRVVRATPDRVIDLGPPPGRFRRQSRSWASKLARVQFPHPGQYEFWVEFDAIPQARISVTVEAGS